MGDETRVYDVPDISCAHCRAAILEEVGRVAGDAGVEVDLEAKRVTVTGPGLDDAALRGRSRRRASMSAPEREAATAERLEVPITGMTCASCATRVEKRLNRIEGVAATVNYATHTASVTLDPSRASGEDLVASVEAAGYGARLPDGDGASAPAGEEGAAGLRRRLVISALLSAPVLALSMVPPLQFDGWQWVVLVLSTPVVVWAGLPFHRAAWVNLRHGAATMDTLVSVGTLAAYGWSVVALAFLGAGDPDMRMGIELVPTRGGPAEVYFEVAAVVTTFILAGRYFEARATRRAGAALRALLALGAKDVAILDADGQERRISIDDLRVGMRFVVRPGERVATDGIVEEGRSAIDRSLLTGESVPVEVAPGEEVVGATVNAGGRLVVRATRVGAETALAQIARMVEEAQAGKAPIQRLADRVSSVFVPLVLALASGRSSSGWRSARVRPTPSRPRWPCSSSPVPARSGWRPRPR